MDTLEENIKCLLGNFTITQLPGSNEYEFRVPKSGQGSPIGKSKNYNIIKKKKDYPEEEKQEKTQDLQEPI